MKTPLSLFGAIFPVIMVKCSLSHPPEGEGQETHSLTDAALFNWLVMSRKPANVISVREALTRGEGEKVVVSGQVPPEHVKPYHPAVAFFVMLDPTDLKTDEVNAAFQFPNAATSAECRKLLNRLSVRVELVDITGLPVPTTLEGFCGLRPGSTITVEGEVRRAGKKRVRIVATRFFPE